MQLLTHIILFHRCVLYGLLSYFVCSRCALTLFLLQQIWQRLELYVLICSFYDFSASTLLQLPCWHIDWLMRKTLMIFLKSEKLNATSNLVATISAIQMRSTSWTGKEGGDLTPYWTNSNNRCYHDVIWQWYNNDLSYSSSMCWTKCAVLTLRIAPRKVDRGSLYFIILSLFGTFSYCFACRRVKAYVNKPQPLHDRCRPRHVALYVPTSVVLLVLERISLAHAGRLFWCVCRPSCIAYGMIRRRRLIVNRRSHT